MTTVEHHLRDEALKPENRDQQCTASAALREPTTGRTRTLRDPDERLRLAIEAGAVGTWDFDPSSGALTWSERCKSLFGLGGGEHPTIDVFFASLDPDDRAIVERKVAAALDPNGDGSYEAEFRIRRGDGSQRTVMCKGRAVIVTDDDGVVSQRLIGTVVDMTQRRRSEDYSRLLAEASTMLASSLDLEVMLAGIGKLACQRFADAVAIDLEDENGVLTRAATVECDGRRPRVLDRARVANPDSASWAEEHPVVRALREQRTIRMESVTAADRDAMSGTDDHRRTVHEAAVSSLIAAPLVARGRVLGAISFLRTTNQPGYDAAEQLVGEELARRTATAIENAQLYRAALAASEAKSSFLAAMSHELRTPLTAIIGYEELLADGITGPVTEPQRHQLGRIKASATHLLGLIDEILTYSRVEAGSEQPHFESLSVLTALEEAASIVEPLVTDRGLALDLSVDATATGAHVHTDAQKVRQILVNLLSNATKFTERGTIALGARREGRQLLVYVRDTGIGIAEEHQHRIFEPFWQVNSRATHRIAGTGLGLTVSRRLAQMIGGELRVESSPGQGSTFTLELPLDARPMDPIAPRQLA